MVLTKNEILKCDVKVSEFVNQLNELCAGFVGKKVSVGDLHDDIKKAVKDEVEKIGLEFSLWKIAYDYDETIFKYNIEITEDKRYKKYQRIGIVDTVAFTPAMEVEEDVTIGELVRRIRIEEKRKNLKRLNEQLIEIRKQEEEVHGYILELDSEISELEAIKKH